MKTLLILAALMLTGCPRDTTVSITMTVDCKQEPEQEEKIEQTPPLGAELPIFMGAPAGVEPALSQI